ncbi:MAG: glycosyltransferase family 39 protein [Bdellovibrionales bacterium]|nr:glycosyltransferase family 39 protein [Bdellovibrionales bacterium]
MLRNFDSFTALIVSILILYLCLFGYTLSDYGLNFDAALGEIHLGDRYFHFLTSFDWKYLDFTQSTIDLYNRESHPDFFAHSAYAIHWRHHFWGFAQTLTAASKYVLYGIFDICDPIDAHHFVLGLLVALQALVLSLFVRRELGTTAALFCTIALLSHPRFWAHAHNNPKDITEAALYTFIVVSFYKGIIKDKSHYITMSAVLWGLALATKANALFLTVILGPWVGIVALARWRRKESLISGTVFDSLLWFPFLGLATTIVAWPLLMVNFPEYVGKHFNFLLWRGLEGPNHWQIMPWYKLLITTPPVFLVLGILGILMVFVSFFKRQHSQVFYPLLLLWFFIPILRVSIPKANDFDMIRHWIEFLPAFAILAGIGARSVVDVVGMVWQRVSGTEARFLRLPTTSLVFAALAFSPTLYWNVKNHPYQVVYFNDLVGGLAGAQEKGLLEATDYWGSSYRVAYRWLNENVEPHSILFVGFAEHIVDMMKDIRLRKDIQFKKFSEFEVTMKQHDGPVYLMYATRKRHYQTQVHDLDRTSNPVHEVRVDGGVVLRILKL